jgi:hypothetical protein
MKKILEWFVYWILWAITLIMIWWWIVWIIDTAVWLFDKSPWYCAIFVWWAVWFIIWVFSYLDLNKEEWKKTE